MAKSQLARTVAHAGKPKSAPRPRPGENVDTFLAAAAPLRRLLAQAKEKGSINYDQLNAVLPVGFPGEKLDELITHIEGLGIGVVRDDAMAEGEAEPATGESEGEETAEPAAEEAEEPEEGAAVVDEDLGRTDDPVRMYLREMGTIELLSREGEIEIAKRIEAGRNMVLEALCESPLTMRAVIGWRDAIRDGRVLLRDIIDLEATQEQGPAAETAVTLGDAVLELGAEAAQAAAVPAKKGAAGKASDKKAAATAEADDADSSSRGGRRGRSSGRTRRTPARRLATEPPAPASPRRRSSTRTRSPWRRSRASSGTACSRPSIRLRSPMAGCAGCRTSDWP